MVNKMNDLDRLEEDISELRSDMYSLENRVGHPPFFLVTWKDGKRKYVGAFDTEKSARNFVNSCRLKNGREFRKRSPLGDIDTWTIERYYVPEHIPVEPTFSD